MKNALMVWAELETVCFHEYRLCRLSRGQSRTTLRMKQSWSLLWILAPTLHEWPRLQHSPIHFCTGMSKKGEVGSRPGNTPVVQFDWTAEQSLYGLLLSNRALQFLSQSTVVNIHGLFTPPLKHSVSSTGMASSRPRDSRHSLW